MPATISWLPSTCKVLGWAFAKASITTCFSLKIGKISELQKGIGLFFVHRIKKGFQPGWAVVHHILMQIGDQTELDGTLIFERAAMTSRGKRIEARQDP